MIWSHWRSCHHTNCAYLHHATSPQFGWGCCTPIHRLTQVILHRRASNRRRTSLLGNCRIPGSLYGYQESEQKLRCHWFIPRDSLSGSRSGIYNIRRYFFSIFYTPAGSADSRNFQLSLCSHIWYNELRFLRSLYHARKQFHLYPVISRNQPHQCQAIRLITRRDNHHAILWETYGRSQQTGYQGDPTHCR